MPRPRGLPKTGGRKKGSLNKSTVDFKETLESLDFDVAEEAVKLYRELEQHDLKLKTLDFIATYSVSKPKDQIDITEADESSIDTELTTAELLQVVKQEN